METCKNCNQTRENCECDVLEEYAQNNPNQYHGFTRGGSRFFDPRFKHNSLEYLAQAKEEYERRLDDMHQVIKEDGEFICTRSGDYTTEDWQRSYSIEEAYKIVMEKKFKKS
jgi:hypothetical protein